MAEAISKNKIVIAGGGVAAIFAGYQILKTAHEAEKKITVEIWADRISAPCSAGSHIVLELEGMFTPQMWEHNKLLAPLLRQGLKSLVDTVALEKINCRLDMGYEIKGTTQAELEKAVGQMLDNGIYERGDFIFNSRDAVLDLTRHPFSAVTECIGQICAPELMAGMIEAFKERGGIFYETKKYEGQEIDATLLLATGAVHLQPLFPSTTIVHTMCMVFGPLSPEDAAQISNRPTAFCDSAVDGDVLWGGLDPKNYFTIGKGHIIDPTPAQRRELEAELKTLAESFYPCLKKYPHEISFGPMLHAQNRMPIVGRMQDYMVASGWAGMGIVASYAAANAFAKYIVNDDDSELLIFENLQPDFF